LAVKDSRQSAPYFGSIPAPSQDKVQPVIIRRTGFQPVVESEAYFSTRGQSCDIVLLTANGANNWRNSRDSRPSSRRIAAPTTARGINRFESRVENPSYMRKVLKSRKK
jgi:hypothetical protein